MIRLRRLLWLAALGAALGCSVQGALAGPDIDISFEGPDANGQRVIHARALFPVAGAEVQRVFEAIGDYPSLHDWIDSARLVASDAHSEQFLVEFRFPWPVGRQWSRVEVRRQGEHAIEWHQVEGSLKANHGRIAFASRGADAHIDYRAVIDVGLPEPLSRPYKKRFVSEFLDAVHLQASTAGTLTGVALASR